MAEGTYGDRNTNNWFNAGSDANGSRDFQAMLNQILPELQRRFGDSPVSINVDDGTVRLSSAPDTRQQQQQQVQQTPSSHSHRTDVNQNTAGQHPHAHGHSHTANREESDAVRLNAASIVKSASSCLPFVLLIFVKTMYDHRWGKRSHKYAIYETCWEHCVLVWKVNIAKKKLDKKVSNFGSFPQENVFGLLLWVVDLQYFFLWLIDFQTLWTTNVQGLALSLAMFGTFFYANNTLKKQVTQRLSGHERHSNVEALGQTVWIGVFMAGNIAFIYFTFEAEHLYKALYFFVPPVTRMDVWTMLWIVGITDFVVKFGTVIVKSLITLIPRPFLPVKRRGKYYMIVEEVVQFYRCVLPIVPWFHFLGDKSHGGEWVSGVLLVLYVLFKIYHVYTKCSTLRKALAHFRLDVTYGSVPTREEVKAVDHTCAICQDNLSEPVKLSCSHIFCEDCVSLWFDREKTCPMCRAQIVDNPQWRDGSTDGNLQLY